MTETRETFAGLAHWEIVLWYCLIALSTAVFLCGVVLLARKYRRGRGGFRLDRPWRRLARTARIVLTHAWIRRRGATAGLGHLLIFYGFAVLFLGSAILAFQDDVARPLLGFDFWRGPFYLGYSLFLDAFGAALLTGLAAMAVRRGIVRPFRLGYGRTDRKPDGDQRHRVYAIGDWLFLGTLLFLAASGFMLEAFRIAETDPSFERWSPLGWLAGQAFRGLGLSGGEAGEARLVLWWVHGLAALTFVSSIPFTKAVHLLAGPVSVLSRDEPAGRRLAPIPPGARADEIGYGLITDLAPRHLLQLDACTRCGKCHEACPATASGYPLSPRDLILDLREHAEGTLGIRSTLRIPPLHGEREDLTRGTIRPETLWSCFACLACVEICPVGIEHVPIISQLRRRLVDRGELDPLLGSALERIYVSGNSFGEPRHERGRWTDELEVKDIRTEPAELLWFVGDYASFSPRVQRATRALARVLDHAGVDFGILYDGESNAGCDVRRAGEEGLFVELAEGNLAAISSCRFERILTADPHSLSTLRNEYPGLGAEWTVVHHSELLLELIESGRLLPRGLGAKVTYHDPCHLGRYNGVYDPPRRVLAAIGAELVEMPRCRDNSFCCGAGGGRIWMREPKESGRPRPAELRIDEATALGDLDYFVVCCPKDVTMYEDAIETSGHEGEIELRELSELVLESLELGPG